jgi:hypothetical protein
MESCTPADRHAAMMASHSATVLAIGFSQMTCLPAFAAAMQCSACSPLGVTTYTMSMAGLSASRAMVS